MANPTRNDKKWLQKCLQVYACFEEDVYKDVHDAISTLLCFNTRCHKSQVRLLKHKFSLGGSLAGCMSMIVNEPARTSYKGGGRDSIIGVAQTIITVELHCCSCLNTQK